MGNPLVGNPTLRPETSSGFDLGLRADPFGKRLEASLTYFDLGVRDQVDFEEGPPPRLVNRSKVVSRGVELELLARPTDELEFASHGSYTATDIRGTGEDLRNRPRWRGDASLAWSPQEALTLSLRGLFVGETRDSSIPMGDVELGAYARVDLALSWRLLDHLTVHAAVDNVFDERFEQAVGFRAPGVRPRVGLDLCF